MDNFNQYEKRQNQMFILVCINFALFLILFSGLGFLTWQSISLTNRLKSDLSKAELAVSNLQAKLNRFEPEVLTERLIAKTTEQLSIAINEVLQDTELARPLLKVSEQITTTQEMMKETRTTITEVKESIKKFDQDQIAQHVSYTILKGLGDGFQKAAQTHTPSTSDN